MDRSDAIRLLEALVAAGMDTRAPRANAWIEKRAADVPADVEKGGAALLALSR